MNTRRVKILNLCHAIVASKVQHDVEMTNGTVEIVDPKTNLPIRFITIRFLNVLFGKAIKPLLAQRDRVLVHNQLEEKLKTDETLWKYFISECNSEKEIHGVNAFPSLEIKNYRGIFLHFQKINGHKLPISLSN